MKDYEKSEKKAAEKMEILQKILVNTEIRESEKLKIDYIT